MPENITFRGTILKHFDLRQGKEGGDTFVRIHFSADYSEQVREKMDWERIPDSIMDAKLSGELLATHLVLTPGDKQLRNHELNFDISNCEDFQVVPLKNDEGEVRGRELRFVVRTPSEIEGFLGQHIRRVGRHAGALKISYSKQDDLPLEDAKPAEEKAETSESQEADSGCVLCNNGVPKESATLHANGQPCAAAEPSTLASARQAAGGTHARRKKDSLAEAAAVN